MNKNPAKVFIILFDPLIEPPNIRLIQETQNPLLQLTGALAGNYFYQINLFLHRIIHNAVQLIID